MGHAAAAVRQRLSEPRFILIHDDRFAAEAEWLARLFVLEKMNLDDLSEYKGSGPARLLAYVDLLDFATAKAFRNRVGAPPDSREWAFVRPVRSERLWQVQADALGATAHVSREDAPLARRKTISRLGLARPVSTKLRWRAEISASKASSSWLRRRRCRQSRIFSPICRLVLMCCF